MTGSTAFPKQVRGIQHLCSGPLGLYIILTLSTVLMFCLFRGILLPSRFLLAVAFITGGAPRFFFLRIVHARRSTLFLQFQSFNKE